MPGPTGSGDDERGISSDADLVSAVTRGDRRALARLYDLHASLLLTLGLRILGDRTAAEDVLHDVFLEAWHRAADFDPARGSVRAWLVTRMRSRALDRRATGARQARLAEEAGRQPVADEPQRSGELAAPLDGPKLRLQMSAMPGELYLVLELAYFEGLSSSEIAERLHIPTGTVKSRMARAMSALRSRLGPETADVAPEAGKS